MTLSNVNVVNDMADAIMASKLYEANLDGGQHYPTNGQQGT
ncbi:MAG: hypothetical protein R2857_01165 [Vampirovibrionales bacterium]